MARPRDRQPGGLPARPDTRGPAVELRIARRVRSTGRGRRDPPTPAALARPRVARPPRRPAGADPDREEAALADPVASGSARGGLRDPFRRLNQRAQRLVIDLARAQGGDLVQALDLVEAQDAAQALLLEQVVGRLQADV